MARNWVSAFQTSVANATRRVDASSGGGGGSNLYVTLENNGVIGSKAEMEKWLTDSLEQLRRKGKL
jgi:hypothetical protein